jgi:IS5 family transposase
MKTFKRSKSIVFFDEDFRLSKLTQLGDPLARLNAGIDFEIFRTVLTEKLTIESKGKGGRRPYDYVLMFKILILQRYYNISDDQAEYQICDRLSFMRFLGLTLADDVPDSKTIWNFRERVTDLDLAEVLFELFIKELTELNLIIHEGKIIDASFVEVPKQRNSREENKAIKERNIPADWQNTSHKLAQKDTDARWTKKNDVSYFGYKNHAKCDEKSKLLTGYSVTNAAVHDSQEAEDLLTKEDEQQPFYADSAYVGAELNITLINTKKVIPLVIEKGYKNKPLTEQQKTNNKEKSKIRVRVEHVFGFIENSMSGSFIRSIGIKRATTIIGLMNLTYNLFRKIQIA